MDYISYTVARRQFRFCKPRLAWILCPCKLRVKLTEDNDLQLSIYFQFTVKYHLLQPKNVWSKWTLAQCMMAAGTIWSAFHVRKTKIHKIIMRSQGNIHIMKQGQEILLNQQHSIATSREWYNAWIVCGSIAWKSEKKSVIFLMDKWQWITAQKFIWTCSTKIKFSWTYSTKIYHLRLLSKYI